MNSAEQVRLELSKSLALKLDDVGAHAIFIGGSVAKGWADDYSDIELCLCWEDVPDSDTRSLIIEQLSATDVHLSSASTYEPFEDNFLVDGLQIDLWHCSNEAIQRFISKASVAPLSIGKQETLWAIQNGVVLKNSELLEKWRSTIQFPRSIQAIIVESHLEVITSCDLQLHAKRGDVAILFGLISGIQKRIVYLLFALNGSFSMGAKNMAKSLSALEIKPRDTWKRFQEAYKAHLSSCVEETELLIDDVVELVQEHLPEVRVTELNRFQAFRRSAWSPTRRAGA